MTYSIRDAGRALSDYDISQLETKLSTSLPVDYVNFLKHHNGGRPTPKSFEFAGRGGARQGQVLDFFGIDDPVQSCEILWNARVLAGRIPPSFLPIACEDGGNIICLRLSEEEFGAVYYWDCVRETVPPTMSNMFKVGESFQLFMKNLF